MKKGKVLLMIFCIALILVGCGQNGPESEISLSEFNLAGVTEITLNNCHNGEKTTLTDAEDIAAVTDFLQSVTGADPQSGKGYYEGSYVVQLYRDGEEVLSIGFGDSDCFYMGDFGDGYPARYVLTDITVSSDVIPFFSRYDESGFVWE
ncbi:MAG: hypothetical protein IJ001_07470 [Oscillospiraceae bacterium]|nr:hypothetical protein [Oscillospiraceae bacterium]